MAGHNKIRCLNYNSVWTSTETTIKCLCALKLAYTATVWYSKGQTVPLEKNQRTEAYWICTLWGTLVILDELERAFQKKTYVSLFCWNGEIVRSSHSKSNGHRSQCYMIIFKILSGTQFLKFNSVTLTFDIVNPKPIGFMFSETNDYAKYEGSARNCS